MSNLISGAAFNGFKRTERDVLLLPAGDYLIGSPSPTRENTVGTQSTPGEQEKGAQERWGGIRQWVAREIDANK